MWTLCHYTWTLNHAAVCRLHSDLLEPNSVFAGPITQNHLHVQTLNTLLLFLHKAIDKKIINKSATVLLWFVTLVVCTCVQWHFCNLTKCSRGHKHADKGDKVEDILWNIIIHGKTHKHTHGWLWTTPGMSWIYSWSVMYKHVDRS